MPKVSVIGICGQSTFLYVDHFHQNGETIFTDNSFKEIGGKGINQAIAAKRTGIEVSFLAAVGDDCDGKLCKELLQRENIKSFLTVKKDMATTFAFVLVDKNGENQVTVYHGAELSKEDILSFSQEIKSSNILLLQQEIPKEVNEFAIAVAQEYGIPVVLNPAPEGLIPDFCGKLFAVTPNKHESRFVDFDNFEHNVVTLGKDGCLVDNNIVIPASKVDVVDTTGAGDTFNGVMAAMLAKKYSFEDACRYGVCAASLSVTKEYVINAIPYMNDIERSI